MHIWIAGILGIVLFFSMREIESQMCQAGFLEPDGDDALEYENSSYRQHLQESVTGQATLSTKS